MKLHLEAADMAAMVSAVPDLASLNDQLRFGEKVEVQVRQLSSNELILLENVYLEGGAARATLAAQIATVRRALNEDGTRFAAGDLESLLPAIARHLSAGAIRGWMFTASVANLPLPYVVSRLDDTPPSNDEAGRVFIELKANAKGTIASVTLRGSPEAISSARPWRRFSPARASSRRRRSLSSVSGRDIKGLAKLVAKYCHHRKIAPSRAVFQRCAIFRGIDAEGFVDH